MTLRIEIASICVLWQTKKSKTPLVGMPAGRALGLCGSGSAVPITISLTLSSDVLCM